MDDLTTGDDKHVRADEDDLTKVDWENTETASLQHPGRTCHAAHDVYPGSKDLIPNKDLSLLPGKELSIQPGKLQSLSSKLSLSSCQDQGDQEQHKGIEESKESETLSLKLEEVKHIQIVLSKARIEVSSCIYFLLLILELLCGFVSYISAQL